MNDKDFTIIKDLVDSKPSNFMMTDEQLAAEGMVRLAGGAIIKRSDAVYGLRDVGTAANDVHVLATIDGTYYGRDKNGTLRRETPKPLSKKERRKAARN